GRGPFPPRRWIVLSGADRGSCPSPEHARHPLASRLLPSPQGALDGAASRQRDPRRVEQLGGRDQTQGRRPQDGGVEQGLRTLPLVSSGRAPAPPLGAITS